MWDSFKLWFSLVAGLLVAAPVSYIPIILITYHIIVVRLLPLVFGLVPMTFLEINQVENKWHKYR
jgi:hypothetical protein